LYLPVGADAGIAGAEKGKKLIVAFDFVRVVLQYGIPFPNADVARAKALDHDRLD
jgi:hypothetical protein